MIIIGLCVIQHHMSVDAQPSTELDAQAAASRVNVGDTVEFEKTISDEDVRQFAAVSGDTNPLHLDEEFASETMFAGRIAHGMLVGSLISAALSQLPGVVVYLFQDLEFQAPVRRDTRLTAECELTENLDDEKYRVTTRVVDGNDVVIDGEATILIDGDACADTVREVTNE